MSLLHSITFSGTNHHQRSILDLDTYLHLLEDPFIAFEYGEEVLQHFQTTKSLKKIEKNFFKLWEDVFVTLENLPSRKTTETGTHQQPIDIKLEEMESLITFHPRPSHQSIFNVQYQVLKVLHALFKSIRLQKKGPKKLYSTTLSNFLTTWIQVALPSFYSFIRTLVTLPLYLSTLGLTILMDVVKFSHLPDLSSTYLLMKNQWVPILHQQLLQTSSPVLYRKYIKWYRKLNLSHPSNCPLPYTFLLPKIELSSLIFSTTCDGLISHLSEDQETQITYVLLLLQQKQAWSVTSSIPFPIQLPFHSYPPERFLTWLSTHDQHVIDFLQLSITTPTFSMGLPNPLTDSSLFLKGTQKKRDVVQEGIELFNLACTTLFSSHLILLDYLLASSSFLIYLLHLCKWIQANPTSTVFSVPSIHQLSLLLPCLSLLPYNAAPLKRALEEALKVSLTKHGI